MGRRRPSRYHISGGHRSETLRALADRPLRVVVVADTHSRPHPDAAALIEQQRPDAILHAGDIGSLDVVDELAGIAPCIAVRGNIDEGATGVPASVDLTVREPVEEGVEDDDGRAILRLLLLHIAVQGPKIRADAAKKAKEHGAAMIVCGHSHVPFLGRDRGLLVFNPGSIGPRRFRLPITFGVMEVSDDRLDLRHISCETGETWLP
jgi:putative phosphoesterase